MSEQSNPFDAIELDIDWSAPPSKTPVRGPHPITQVPPRPVVIVPSASPTFDTPEPASWWPRRDGAPVYGPPRPQVDAISRLINSMGAYTALVRDRATADANAQRETEVERATHAVAQAVQPLAPLQANAAWCTCPLGTRAGLEYVNGQRLCVTCHKPRVVRPVGAPRPQQVNAANRAVMAAIGEARSSRTEAATGVDTTVLATRAAITARDVVIGAKSEASGVLVGWAGMGEMSRGQLQSALRAAGLPEEWAPASKSARAHAGVAVMALASTGLVPRAEVSRRTMAVTGQRTAQNPRGREYDARWTVGVVDHTGDVGAAFGEIALTVTLRGDVLTCEGDVKLRERVESEYRRTLARELYLAGDVTEWLRGVLYSRFHAVKLGANLYVKARDAAAAERLCEALASGAGDERPGWGSDWILPALPVSTTDQLKAGLARGFITEAMAVLADLEARRREARAQGRSEIGERAAATLLGRLQQVVERAKSYHEILGDSATRNVLDAAREAVAKIEPLLDDTSKRGAALEMYAPGERKA